MNIDGATAVIFAELGFAPPLCRGLFVLSRSVGALAHAWEEKQSGERNKGPIPRHLLWTYTGPAARPVPERKDKVKRLRPVLRDGPLRGPPQDEAFLLKQKQPHAEERRASDASRSMGRQRRT